MADGMRRVLGVGLLASVVMGMIEMIYEAVAGAGFWAPVVFIGATVVRRLQLIQGPVPFDLTGVVLGLMGHMMNSALVGLIFVRVFALAAVPRGALVGWGVVYGLVILGVMWFAVLPVIDPVMLRLNPAVFAIAHVAWGATLGAFVPASSRVPGELQSA